MPSDPLEVAARAEQLRGAGRPDQAVALLSEALAEAPDHPVLLVELSSARRVLGDLRGAEQAVRAALQQAPQFALALLRLTIVLVQQNRMEEAIGAAGALLAVDAESAAGWAYLALARSGLRRTADRLTAREASRRSLELAPDDPTFRYMAAIVEHALGDVGTARALVDQGLSLDPQSPSLLALRAEYAPVRDQPALLVDVLTANPGDAESRELLDAAVTWERRVALTTAVLLPPLVAVVGATGRWAPSTTIAALVALLVGLLVLLRFRRRRGILPAGYLASRAAAARGTTRLGAVVIATGAAEVAGAATSWFAPDLAVGLLVLAVALGWAAVLTALPDDSRVLATARLRHGRVRWGTAWRYGGLRQELALWSGLGIGFVALVGAPAASVARTPGPLVALLALACAAGVVVQLVDAGVGGGNAPQRYLRTVAVRYRFFIASAMVLGLLGLAATAASGASLRPVPRETVPSIDLETPFPTISIPTFDFSPIPTITVSAG